ncbi:MAG TPA: sulfotransferase family 2 domain-containing protein [Candidatus Binataceae bacterium]|nr:sulfotransferase family 2 domain-containing protein [Candidatus Binataceae bacterium]
MQSGAKQPVIIFVHLPKCGGTTLFRLVEWEYSPTQVFFVDGRFYRWSYNRLIHSRADKLANMQVFQGHMPFGLHKLLDAPATYMTMLREPVDRVISEYYYRINRLQHPYEDRWMKKLSLEEYVRTTPQHNIQTKLLAGRHSGYDFLAGDCTEETLAVAKENLAQQFSLIGLTERFEESLALAKLAFGWKIEHFADFNITGKRPAKSSVAPAIRDLISEFYQYDVALYEHVVGLFNQAVARRQEQISAELAAVRQARSHGTLDSLGYRVGSSARHWISRLHSAMLIM